MAKHDLVDGSFVFREYAADHWPNTERAEQTCCYLGAQNALGKRVARQVVINETPDPDVFKNRVAFTQVTIVCNGLSERLLKQLQIRCPNTDELVRFWIRKRPKDNTVNN